VAEQLTNPGVLLCVELPDDFEIVEVQAPKSILDRTLGDINLSERYKLNLVTLLRMQEGKHHIMGLPDKSVQLIEDDILVLFGRSKDINRFIEINQ
jgi:trk system potassium uptake protein TrkA